MILPPITNLDQVPDGLKNHPRISIATGCYMFSRKKVN
jgi:hypothetical protein